MTCVILLSCRRAVFVFLVLRLRVVHQGKPSCWSHHVSNLPWDCQEFHTLLPKQLENRRTGEIETCVCVSMCVCVCVCVCLCVPDTNLAVLQDSHFQSALYKKDTSGIQMHFLESFHPGSHLVGAGWLRV